MQTKALASSLLTLIPVVQSNLLSGQFGGGYYPVHSYGGYPGNFYGGGGGPYGGYPGYYGDYRGYGGVGFNPTFFTNNKDLNSNNFRANQFDRNTNAAVFNDDIHKKNVDANNVNKDSSTSFFST